MPMSFGVLEQMWLDVAWMLLVSSSSLSSITWIILPLIFSVYTFYGVLPLRGRNVLENDAMKNLFFDV